MCRRPACAERATVLSVTTILIVTALLVVPGTGAALAVAPPGAAAIETRIALAFGLGYAIVAAVAMGLALARILTAPAFVVALVVATVVAWFLALRRGSPRAHASAVVGEAREAPFALAAGLVVLAAVALTWPLYPPGLNLEHVAPWRYWADGLELAAAGRVPPTSDQWGYQVPMAVDKIVLNAFEGGASFLIGPDPLAAMHAILTVAALGLAACLLALARELGLRTFAWLVPALLVLFPGRLPITKEFAEDLVVYKAENIGRVAALAALLVGILAVRGRRGIALAAVGGVVLALAALTHGVAAIVAAVALALFSLAVLIADRGRWRHVFASGAALVAVAGVAYLGMLVLSRGDLGFQRVTSGPAFAGFPRDIDPTRSFDRSAVVRVTAKEGRFFIPPERILRRYAVTTVGGDEPADEDPGGGDRGDETRLGALVIVALAIVTGFVVFLRRTLVPLAIVAWGLALAFVAGAFFFSYRYRTQIPGDFGLRRLYDYAGFLPALVVAAGVETVAGWAFRRRPIVAGALALVGCALAVYAAVDRIPSPDPEGRGAAGLAVIDTVAHVVPCDARLLPNARTAGTWEAMTGRRSVIEGLAPYLRPDVMGRVLPMLIDAKRFFRAPETNREFLVRQRIDYVVVVGRRPWIGARAPYG